MKIALLPDTEAGEKLAEFLKVSGFAEIVEIDESLQLAPVDERMKQALLSLKREGMIHHGYDYVWVMRYLNEKFSRKGDLFFDSVKSFREYLTDCLGIEGVPQVSTLSLYYNRVEGKYPDWTFSDTNDHTEQVHRGNVARRFASVFIRGK